MPRSAKIAVTVPDDLLREVERLRRRTRETRSAVVQRALRVVLKRAELDARLRQYEEGYRQLPESDAEVDAAERRARAVLTAIDWDE